MDGGTNRFLAAEAAGLVRGRALDIACGEGRNGVWLAERGWTVTGVDSSAVGIDKARRLATARSVSVQWDVADITEYEPSPDGFEFVIVMYPHLTAASRYIAFGRASAAFADGGTLLVVGHDITSMEDGWGGPAIRLCCTARTTSSPTQAGSRS